MSKTEKNRLSEAVLRFDELFLHKKIFEFLFVHAWVQYKIAYDRSKLEKMLIR